MKKWKLKSTKFTFNKSFIILFFLFLFSRLFLIFYSPYIFHPEEIKETSLGLDLATGELKLPFWAYIDSPHAGGSIFTALVNIPFYLIFGRNYLAQKINSLFFSLLIFLFLIKILTQEYGNKIIIPLAFLFIFPTPQYLRFSFFNIGNIQEPLFFLLISLYLVYKIFFKREDKTKNFFYLGLSIGFGLWIHYLIFTVIVTLLVIWFLKDGLFFLKKDFLRFFIGFLIGFSPFIIYNFFYEFASFNSDQVINASVLIQHPIDSLIKLKNLLLFYLPRSLQIKPTLLFKSSLISWFVYLIFLGSFFYLLKEDFKKRKKPSLEFLFIVYLIFSLLMITFTKTRLGGIDLEWGIINNYKFYYIYFFQPFFLILTSIFIFKLSSSKRKWERIFAWFSLSFLMVIFIINYFHLLSFNNFNFQLFKPNYNIHINAYEAGFSHARNKAFLKIYHSIPDNLKLSFLRGAGANWNYFLTRRDLEEKIVLFKYQLEALEIEENVIFLKGVLKGEDQKFDKFIYEKLYHCLNSEYSLIIEQVKNETL